jgi:hypothetical protein
MMTLGWAVVVAEFAPVVITLVIIQTPSNGPFGAA